MNRNEEYHQLMAQLEHTPEALETTVNRALQREAALQKKRRIWSIPVGSLAACFVGFVLLVNCFPIFAYACEGIPLLRELAEAVSWSPSLSEAVENEFVQPIGQSQTVNGITATVEYLIVDQKQVNIFFTLEGDYDNLSAEMPEFMPAQHCSVQGALYRQAPGTLLNFTMDYVDDNVPSGFNMTFGVTTYEERKPGEPPAVESSVFDEYVPEEPNVLATFSFDLEFDPEFTAQGEVIPVNQSLAMAGQTVTITQAEIYPTHIRINVQGTEENSAWLKSMDFYLENERGERFDPISNGITASGSDKDNGEVSYRLESSYFRNSKHLTLHITGATWLDKNRERIPIDLTRGTAEWLPEDVSLYSTARRGTDWVVQFCAPEIKENHHYQLFYTHYFDAEGTEYDTGGMSSSTMPHVEGPLSGDALEAYEHAQKAGVFYDMLILRDYPGDTVWMCPVFSHRTAEDIPQVVTIK